MSEEIDPSRGVILAQQYNIAGLESDLGKVKYEYDSLRECLESAKKGLSLFQCVECDLWYKEYEGFIYSDAIACFDTNKKHYCSQCYNNMKDKDSDAFNCMRCKARHMFQSKN